MSKEAILIPLVIGVLVCGLNAWVNIKIKFAPNADHAKRDAIAIFMRIAFIAHFGFSALLFIFELLSSEPFTRGSARNLAVGLFGVIMDTLCYLLLLLIKNIDKLTTIVGVLLTLKQPPNDDQTA